MSYCSTFLRLCHYYSPIVRYSELQNIIHIYSTLYMHLIFALSNALIHVDAGIKLVCYSATHIYMESCTLINNQYTNNFLVIIIYVTICSGKNGSFHLSIQFSHTHLVHMQEGGRYNGSVTIVFYLGNQSVMYNSYRITIIYH